MPTIDTNRVIEQVRINLDEISLNDSNFDAGKDEQELDTIIKQKIGEAYRFVLMNSNEDRITNELVVVRKTDEPIDGVSSLRTSSNILRFMYANEKNWKFPVFLPIYWNTSEYAKLSNSRTTGTKDRPKVGIQPFIENGVSKGQRIDLYGCSEAGEVGYIPDPRESDFEGLYLTDLLYKALLYYVTALVLLTLREHQHSEKMLAQALTLMGIDASAKAT